MQEKLANVVSEPQAARPMSYSSGESHDDSYYEELKKTGRSAELDREGHNRSPQYCEQLEGEILFQQEKVAALGMIIHEQHESVHSIKRSVQQMQLELDDKGPLLGRQGTDDEIVSAFEALLSSIETWSRNFNNISVDLHLFLQAMTEECVQAAPYCRTARYAEYMLSNKKRRGLFIRGLVSCVISKKLFRSDRHISQHGEQVLDLWLEPLLAAVLAVLENRLISAGTSLHWIA